MSLFGRETVFLFCYIFRDILLEDENELAGAGGGGRRRGRAGGQQQSEREITGDSFGMNSRL